MPCADERVPEDASEATEEQRHLHDQLEHQNDDPQAPGGHLDRNDLADEH